MQCGRGLSRYLMVLKYSNKCLLRGVYIYIYKRKGQSTVAMEFMRLKSLFRWC